MPADENASAEAGADTTPEPSPEAGSEHTPRGEPAAEKRAEPSWRIGRTGRLERVGRGEPAAEEEEDDVMALVNAIAPPAPGPETAERTGAASDADAEDPEGPPPADGGPEGAGASVTPGGSATTGPGGGDTAVRSDEPSGGTAEAVAPARHEGGDTATREGDRPDGGPEGAGAVAAAPHEGGPGAGGSDADARSAAVPHEGAALSGTPGGSGSGEGGGPGGPSAVPPGSGGGGNGRRRLRRIAVWTAACLAVLLTAGIATAYGYFHSLRSGMVQHDLEAALDEGERPEKISDAVNILFMGSDGYEEGSTAYSTEFEGERSDSIMLAHISPDDRVSVISFPRDSLVNLPQCDPYGTAGGTYGYFGMINAAMYHGGPPCVVRTIESLTDIRIDHFVHLSFMSFRDVVDAIGGVDMCIPEPMKDERSKLDIPAGEQTLTGDQALSFVRARYEIGDGGDIGRIDRQQMFMAALADQAMRREVLGNPAKLHGILTAVARHSATDSGLTLDRMLSIAVSLSDVDLSDIEFHTVPWYQAPFDPNRILWYEDRAEELFAAVREDRPLPPLMAADEAAVPMEPPGASPSPVDVPSGPPSPEPPAARPGEGRDATSNPCSDGLGFGTGEETH